MGQSSPSAVRSATPALQPARPLRDPDSASTELSRPLSGLREARFLPLSRQPRAVLLRQPQPMEAVRAPIYSACEKVEGTRLSWDIGTRDVDAS